MTVPVGPEQRGMSERVWPVVLLIMAMISPGSATAADLHVFSSGAPATVTKELGTLYGVETGQQVVVTAGTPGTIKKKLASGEKPDIVILPSPVVDSLEKTGAWRPNSRVDLARVGIGIVVRQGATLPDISTADAIRHLLVNARSIVRTNPAGTGFAGAAVARMIARMGIADAVAQKTTIMQAIDGGVDLVAKGDAEIGIFNISEILPIKGVALVGPLPPELQSYIVFTAAIYADAPLPFQAQAFMNVLSNPRSRDRWREGGLEMLGHNR